MSKKQRQHGYYCWACDQYLANEKFSGKGHKNHICKQCAKHPKEKLSDIKKIKELFSYWDQKRLSKKNINRISMLSKATNNEVSELAQVILEVAHICPYRKKRIQRILIKKKEIIPRLETVGLIFDSCPEDTYHNKEENELSNEKFSSKKYNYENDDPMNYDDYFYN